MDTSQQTTVTPRDKEDSVGAQRQRRSIAEKRRIVEATLVPGASVARVARAHGVNANQLFGWRRLYLNGRLGQQKATMKLLPVRLNESLPLVTTHATGEGSASIEFAKPKPIAGTIRIELRRGQVRIEGDADPALVRVLLECLTR
jgi:transposase